MLEALFSHIKDYIANLGNIAYLWLFLADLIPGAGIAVPIFGGFLSTVTYLKLHYLFLIFTAADILTGIIWYCIGYFSGSKPLEKWGQKIKTDKKFLMAEKYFNKYAGLSILIAKFTYGFTIAVEIIAGVFRFSFRNFMFYNLIGSVGWILATIFLGYFFGFSYNVVSNYARSLSLFIIFAAGSIILMYLIMIIVKKTTIKFIKFDDFLQKIKNFVNNNFNNKE